MTEPLVDFSQTVDSVDIPVKTDAFSPARKALIEKYGPDAYREMGKLGGAASAAIHSHEFYVGVGKRGGATTKAKHGVDHLRAAGAKGGAANAAKGPEYFAAIARKRWAKRKAAQS